jgi:hypothetical protein
VAQRSRAHPFRPSSQQVGTGLVFIIVTVMTTLALVLAVPPH